MSIIDIVAKHARLTPDAPALVEIKPVTGGRQEISWAQLDERTNRLADSLIRMGVQKGRKSISPWQEFLELA